MTIYGTTNNQVISSHNNEPTQSVVQLLCRRIEKLSWQAILACTAITFACTIILCATPLPAAIAATLAIVSIASAVLCLASLGMNIYATCKGE